MDSINKNILNHIQEAFPLHPKPFKLLADNLGLNEYDLIERISFLKYDRKIIRTISAIFNGTAFGYKNTLVAIHVDSYKITGVTEIINKLPGVSHNYQRDHYYNLWFTYTTSSNEDISNTISSSLGKYNIDRILILPALKMFKLNTMFNLFDNKDEIILDSSTNDYNIQMYTTGLVNIQVIKQLQLDLPIVSKPFSNLAEQINMDVTDFLDLANDYLSQGIVRRYCATLQHYNIGLKFNAMVVWKVDDTYVEKIGKILSSMKFISHCYERLTYPDWPYNLYSMLHARSEEELFDYINEIQQLISCRQYEILRTQKEHKKERVKYFQGINKSYVDCT